MSLHTPSPPLPVTATGTPDRRSWGSATGVPVLQFIAHGQPKPKGSMRHVGHGRMIEQVDGRPWREAVKWAALQAISTRRSMFPLTGPIHIDATFTFRKPRSAPKTRQTWPTTRSSGDTDKQLRQLFDAMGDAGVYGDDSQIVQVYAAKRFPLEGPDALTLPGVVVRVYLLTSRER